MAGVHEQVAVLWSLFEPGTRYGGEICQEAIIRRDFSPEQKVYLTKCFRQPASGRFVANLRHSFIDPLAKAVQAWEMFSKTSSADGCVFYLTRAAALLERDVEIFSKLFAIEPEKVEVPQGNPAGYSFPQLLKFLRDLSALWLDHYKADYPKLAQSFRDYLPLLRERPDEQGYDMLVGFDEARWDRLRSREAGAVTAIA